MYTRWKQIKAKWDTDIGICGFRSRVLVSHSSSSCSRGYFLHYYGPSAREKHFRVHLSPLFHNRLSLSRWDICCSSCYISSPRFRRSHLWCLWLKTGTELNVLITTFFNQTKTRYWHARPAQNNQITEKQVSKFQECRPWVNRSKCHCQSAHLSGNTFLSCIFMLCFEFFFLGGCRGGQIYKHRSHAAHWKLNRSLHHQRLNWLLFVQIKNLESWMFSKQCMRLPSADQFIFALFCFCKF